MPAEGASVQAVCHQYTGTLVHWYSELLRNHTCIADVASFASRNRLLLQGTTGFARHHGKPRLLVWHAKSHKVSGCRTSIAQTLGATPRRTFLLEQSACGLETAAVCRHLAISEGRLHRPQTLLETSAHMHCFFWGRQAAASPEVAARRRAWQNRRRNRRRGCTPSTENPKPPHMITSSAVSAQGGFYGRVAGGGRTAARVAEARGGAAIPPGPR